MLGLVLRNCLKRFSGNNQATSRPDSKVSEVSISFFVTMNKLKDFNMKSFNFAQTYLFGCGVYLK